MNIISEVNKGVAEPDPSQASVEERVSKARQQIEPITTGREAVGPVARFAVDTLGVKKEDEAALPARNEWKVTWANNTWRGSWDESFSGTGK